MKVRRCSTGRNTQTNSPVSLRHLARLPPDKIRPDSFALARPGTNFRVPVCLSSRYTNTAYATPPPQALLHMCQQMANAQTIKLGQASAKLSIFRKSSQRPNKAAQQGNSKKTNTEATLFKEPRCVLIQEAAKDDKTVMVSAWGLSHCGAKYVVYTSPR